MVELRDKLISPAGISRFSSFVREFSMELERRRKEFRDVASSLKFRRVKCRGKKWALSVLKGVKVVGVDGSQVSPLREFGIPAGAVQVASYEVHHGYGKWGVRYISRITRLEESVDAVRYETEMRALMESCTEKRGDFIFYDGSLTPSFAREMREELRGRFFKAVKTAIKASEESSIPVIGYTDRSYAKDIARANGLDFYDSFILSDMELMHYTEPVEVGDVCFSYARFTPSLPSRVEIPVWAKSRMDRIMEIVCAECLLGSTSAYPFVLERAHHYARISEKEREYLARNAGIMSVSFKWVSKKP